MSDTEGLNQRIDELTNTVNRLSGQFETYLSTVSPGPGTQVVYAKDGDDDDDERRQDFSKDENEERGNWSGRLDFLLACLGYAVGLGNVWRFPYLCFKNGGAVFFIPYVIMLVFVGMPIFFLELSLGQYTSSSPLTCWNMAGIFKGIGYGMVVVSALVAIYYNMIIGWAFYYLFASFTSDLPWQYCDREWNTPWCADRLSEVDYFNCTQMGFTPATDGVCYNETTPYGIFNETAASADNKRAWLAAEEYIEYQVWSHNKDRSTSFSNMGNLKWQLVLCFLLSWIVVVASLIKGVKSVGKVVYFTALFPYVVLVILLVRGLTLDGYYEGIKFYILQPDLEKLKDAQVWKDAAVQIFFSLSASWGGLIALASYNRFHNDCLRDSIIVSLSNCLTSFFAGFVIFSFLGFLAFKQGTTVDKVAVGGPGLAFVVYPSAVTEMPVPTLWSILFFCMLITLGLDSEFALVETCTTSLMDQFPSLRKKKSLVIICTGILFMVCGLPLCTPGGDYLLGLMDDYSGGWNVLLIALLECICISYVYGSFRFKEDIRVMIGSYGCCCFPWSICFPWWMICWAFFTPLGVVFVMIFSWVDYGGSSSGDYEFETWVNAIGWCLTLAVVVSIFLGSLGALFVAPGNLCEKLRYVTHPNKYWGPALPKHRKLVQHLPNFHIDPWNEDTETFSDGKLEMGKADTRF